MPAPSCPSTIGGIWPRVRNRAASRVFISTPIYSGNEASTRKAKLTILPRGKSILGPIGRFSLIVKGRSCRTVLSFSKARSALLVHLIDQDFPSLEFHHFFRTAFFRLTGLRVTSAPGRPIRRRERAKSDKRHAVTFFQRLCRVRSEGIKRFGSSGYGNTRILRHRGNQILLVHGRYRSGRKGRSHRQ